MRAMRLRRLLFAVVAGSSAVLPTSAQGTAADYERARELPLRWAKLDRAFRPAWRWLDGGKALWFVDDRGPAKSWVLVSADGSVRRASRREELDLPDAPERLAPRSSWRRSGGSAVATSITFVNRFERPVRLFWASGEGTLRPYGEVAARGEKELATFEGHQWVVDFAPDDLAGIFVAQRGPGLAVVDAASRDAASSKPPASPRAAELFVRGHDVWRRAADGTETRLSSTGTAEDPLHVPQHWSPDGQLALGFQVEPGEERRVHLVESSPTGQLQPRLHTLDYRKPGDRIDRRRPRLFDVAAGRQIAIDDAPFADAWSIDRVTWAADGREVYCLYNQRGHQVLRLLAIDAASGAVRTVLEERSATFVDWSQKTVLRWLDGGRAFLWASERDGWNHLYRGVTATGELVQLTRGPWLVRGVDHVDEAAGAVWITALGLHPGQDPYHAHLARVGFDGKVVALTDADGSHEWTWAPDRQSFLARWSRVDQPWVTE